MSDWRINDGFGPIMGDLIASGRVCYSIPCAIQNRHFRCSTFRGLSNQLW